MVRFVSGIGSVEGSMVASEIGCVVGFCSVADGLIWFCSKGLLIEEGGRRRELMKSTYHRLTI
jgi:hypothetical protein